MILNIIKIRSFFAFDEKILENKAEKPIQILDYSQVLSYQVSTNFTVQFSQNLYICNYMYTPHRVNVMIKASTYIQRQCILGTNACTLEQNRGSMPIIKGLLKLVSEYDQEIPQSQPQTTPWHREEDPLKPRSHELVRLQNRDLS